MRLSASSRARSLLWLLALCAIAAACSGRGVFKREYEYEEELYLALDGSATLNVNASVASLVALHGLDLDPDPRARVDRERLRALFGGERARASVSLARRDSRRLVHVSVRVDDVRELSRLAPLAWSSYRVARRSGMVTFRQAVGPPAAGVSGATHGAIQWKGDEMVAFRLHLPSEVLSHNSPSGRIERGNILEWEQPLSDRLAGRTLNLAVDLEPESILYTTLILFGASIAAAAVTLVLVIWWIARRGRESEVTEAA
jgi:hypothetical protein